MTKSLIARVALAALMTTMLIPVADRAFAQSADGRSTADVEKENVALRAKVHRLEAENENVGLRAKLDQLQGRQPARSSQPRYEQATAAPAPLPAGPTPLVTRIDVNSPDRTLVMADLPMKAAPILPPIYNWTGFYIGGNVGYSIGSDSLSGVLAIGDVTDAASPLRVAPAGVIGGGQLGYNFQPAPHWAFGFEADFQGSEQKSRTCMFQCITETLTGSSQQLTPTTTHTLDYFGTIRGRFGYVEGSALFYATGGGAWGRVNQTVDVISASNSPGGPPAVNGAAVSGASTIQNKFGFAVGAGAEAALGGNWTGKIEYLYVDLGSIATTLNGSVFSGGATPVTINASSNIRDNIVRVGLNYRIGAPAAPLSAYGAMAAVPPPSPIYNWTGFYVGANVGYGVGQNHHQTDGASDIGGGLFISGSPGSDITPKGFIGGGQFGYNWQASQHWLIGFEADLQGSVMKDTTCISVVCFNQSGGGSPGTNTLLLTQQIDWFSTTRGKVGFIADNSLFYLTGGAAFAHVRQALNVNSSISTPAIFASFQQGEDLVGYAVGGGIETMFWGGWSAKAEYLYMDFADLKPFVTPIGTPPVVLTLTTNSNMKDHIFRIGANYHFTADHY